MRVSEEENSLDLNNLPDDCGKQTGLEESSTTSAGSADTISFTKKSSSSKDNNDDSAKVYECRFCSLKFCKSQALGGHMNRHRQERETETLNRARQLVFGNTEANQLGTHVSLRPSDISPMAMGALGCRGSTYGGSAGDQCVQLPPAVHRMTTTTAQQYPISTHPSYNMIYSNGQHTVAPYSTASYNPMTTRPPPPHDFIVGRVVTGDTQRGQHHHPPPRSMNCSDLRCFGGHHAHGFPFEVLQATAVTGANNIVGAGDHNRNCSDFIYGPAVPLD